MTRNDKAYSLFFQTMYERQMIWKKRFIDGRPGPWTEDPILRDYKFTNVYRGLDRHSQYSLRHIIMPNRAKGTVELLWKTLVFRIFNRPETFEALAEKGWDCGIPDYDNFLLEQDEYTEALLALEAKSFIFTNAYFIRPSSKGVRAKAYAEQTLPALHQIIPWLAAGHRDQDAVLSRLTFVPSIGGFVGYELLRDIVYIDRTLPDGWGILADDNISINIGPGSKLGAQLIYPELKSSGDILAAFKRLLSAAPEELQKISDDYLEPMPYAVIDWETGRAHATYDFNFTLDNIEHWLCEFSKYWRTISVGPRKMRKLKPISNSNLYE